MLMKVILFSIALLTAAPVASAGQDSTTHAASLVSAAATDIAESGPTVVADAVISHIDTKAIANFTLGRHGRSISESDKARFTAALESFLRRQIALNAHQFSGVRVDVLDTAARNARDAIVTTQIHGAGAPLKVRWRVIERGGEWAVVDLELAGIWLAIEQRAQVAAILSRPGADIDDVIAQFG